MIRSVHPKDIEDQMSKLTWYWNAYVWDVELGMTFDEFAKGSKLENPETPDEELFKYFNDMDTDKSKSLSWREFLRAIHPKDIKDIKTKLRWYWQVYVSDKEKGMTLEEFIAGGQLESKDKSKEEYIK